MTRFLPYPQQSLSLSQSVAERSGPAPGLSPPARPPRVTSPQSSIWCLAWRDGNGRPSYCLADCGPRSDKIASSGGVSSS
ncbi:hypothetical protein RRG08_002665 [Elysia crispata]|uniref:Uncharacterized protein n=1 Tax=Elysia crispata TaxID=231223 RepID=A0AAE0XTX1_9GAST|nr:hypothetical protein RRG08_002665 [Elysia crispata]